MEVPEQNLTAAGMLQNIRAGFGNNHAQLFPHEASSKPESTASLRALRRASRSLARIVDPR